MGISYTYNIFIDRGSTFILSKPLLTMCIEQVFLKKQFCSLVIKKSRKFSFNACSKSTIDNIVAGNLVLMVLFKKEAISQLLLYMSKVFLGTKNVSHDFYFKINLGKKFIKKLCRQLFPNLNFFGVALQFWPRKNNVSQLKYL